ncbi:hypothetical protein H311_01294 [Anncaliia algerae PRA109]|nr:hypothetical protein H311_01294 [Anncaliia algerae PRA109]
MKIFSEFANIYFVNKNKKFPDSLLSVGTSFVLGKRGNKYNHLIYFLIGSLKSSKNDESSMILIVSYLTKDEIMRPQLILSHCFSLWLISFLTHNSCILDYFIQEYL